MSEPENHFSFELAAGQLQYMNNFGIAHRRTKYEDYDEPDKKRHLVRIFLRDSGHRTYMG
jgi:alpha-ketoglutarate-dependent taurine dioxygenase